MDEQVKSYLEKTLKESPSLIELYKDIQDDLQKVETELKALADSPNVIISEIGRYLFDKAGKRIRPALLILCAKLFDYSGEEHIHMSTLVETIHTASLIHDDIIDNSETRRGKATVHSRWGPNITVLLGDYLYIKTIHASLQSSHPEITHILTETSSQMIDGELNEYAWSENLGLSEKEYLDILKKKTASLFAASCRIGALLGSAGPEEIELLTQYGNYLGLSFQITDDLLDYTGNKKTLGKPVLSDLQEGRITLPLIHTLSRSDESLRRTIEDLYQKRLRDKECRGRILEIIQSNGALDYTYNKAVEFSRLAQNLIKKLPLSAHRETLSYITNFILYRNQ